MANEWRKLCGVILRTDKMETDSAKGADGFLDELAAFINRIKKEYPQQPVAVAVGAPGDVDNQRGILRYNPNLKFTGVGDWPIAQKLYDKTGILPRVANDATLAMMTW